MIFGKVTIPSPRRLRQKDQNVKNKLETTLRVGSHSGIKELLSQRLNR